MCIRDRARDDDVDVGTDWGDEVLTRGEQPGEQGRRHPGTPQSQRLAELGDAEPGRSPGEGGPGSLDHPVAVAVGLDDGEDLSTAGHQTQGGDIRGEGVEVDARARRADARGHEVIISRARSKRRRQRWAPTRRPRSHATALRH